MRRAATLRRHGARLVTAALTGGLTLVWMTGDAFAGTGTTGQKLSTGFGNSKLPPVVTKDAQNAIDIICPAIIIAAVIAVIGIGGMMVRDALKGHGTHEHGHKLSMVLGGAILAACAATVVYTVIGQPGQVA